MVFYFIINIFFFFFSTLWHTLDTQIHHDILLAWLKRQVALHNNIYIEDTCSSFKDGLALCAIIHRYRPDLIEFYSLQSSDMAANNQLAFDILEKEYGILPVSAGAAAKRTSVWLLEKVETFHEYYFAQVMTGVEMEKCEVPDNLTMLSYLTQIYDTFKGEIPYSHQRKMVRNKCTIYWNIVVASATDAVGKGGKFVLPFFRNRMWKPYRITHF